MADDRLRRALRVAAGICAVGAAIGPANALAAPATWRLEQPAPPAGAPFKVPLGAPGDLRFLGPNRGLLLVEGNATIATGAFFYDGVSWRQHTTVCGGSADSSRIAWAGPTEFWTITEPSRPRAGAGTALCHFKDGAVVGSFSTADSAVDPYRRMNAAACRGPSDCWFAGIGSQDPLGSRVGAFHLRWDGRDLKTVYAPQGRGVSAIAAVGSGFVETTYVGRARENTTDSVELAEPEDSGPRLLHAIGPTGAFANDPFVPAARPGIPADGTELLAIDANATDVWAAGGGAASGPSAPPDGNVARPPIALYRGAGGWQEVALDETLLRPGDVITAIAAMPGSVDAMAAVTRFADRRSTTAKARVVRISPSGAVQEFRLPASGAGRGSAARIACPAPEECWMVTTAGWLFHYTDGTARAQTTDPAFARVIGFRPNESAEQFIPDAPPVDNSLLFAPPPPADQTAPPPAATRARPVIKGVRKPVLRGNRLTVAFTVVRRARIGMVAYRGRRIVARARVRTMKPGKRKLVLTLSGRRRDYPKRLRFVVRVPGETDGNGNDGDTVTTPDSGTATTGDGADSGTNAPPEPVGGGGTTIGRSGARAARP